MEIFEKALHYAQGKHIVNGRYQVPYHPRIGGDYRLHQQAMKILDMAMNYVTRECPDMSERLLRHAVCEQIEVLEKRYGMGWKREDDWWVKHFHEDQELLNTLIFFRELGVHYVQQDKTHLTTARKLRIADHDFGVIFEPSHYEVGR